MTARLQYLGILLALFAGHLRAGLDFTLTPAVQPTAVGAEITFSGTLTNNSATDNLLLNDIHFDLNGQAATALSPDANSFFANVPGVLLPGESYTGPIFTVLLNSAAAASDYSGTVTIRGGSDLFAAGDLQAANFQLSSPTVSLSATASDAYEFGPVSGTLTITRTGSTNYDLPVHYAVTGSAANGIRYAFLSGAATIPAGSAMVDVNVVPIPNDIADGDQTVSLTVSSSSSYNVALMANGTVTIHDKPIDAWRLEQFGNDANNPGIAGDTADPDSDGIANLLEYGVGSNPTLAGSGLLSLVQIQENHLQLQFNRNTAATDIIYVVEARSDLVSGNWSPVITRAPGSGWTANQPGAAANETGSGDVVSVTITDPVPIIDPNTLQPLPDRFLRLRLQR